MVGVDLENYQTNNTIFKFQRLKRRKLVGLLYSSRTESVWIFIKPISWRFDWISDWDEIWSREGKRAKESIEVNKEKEMRREVTAKQSEAPKPFMPFCAVSSVFGRYDPVWLHLFTLNLSLTIILSSIFPSFPLYSKTNKTPLFIFIFFFLNFTPNLIILFLFF